MKIIGLGLAGQEEKTTGYCFMTEDIEEVKELKSNDDITKKVLNIKPDIVAIDAPLSFPKDGNWRKAEEELNKRKIKFFPPKGLKAMETLVRRGRALKEHFEKQGIIVLETFPGAVYDVLEIPRKDNYAKIKRVLKLYGISFPRKEVSQHEIDAITAAFVGRLFLESKVEFLGDDKEGQLVIPKVRKA